MNSPTYQQASNSLSEKHDLLDNLRSQYHETYDYALLDAFIHDVFPNEIIVSSSFGAEAAVLLELISQVDKNTPIIFLDTGHLFPETTAYKDTLADFFKLTNIITFEPNPVHIENGDKDGTLWQRDHDYCCHLRKILPLKEALSPYKSWVTGRKRFQSQNRAQLEKIELDSEGKIKINPLYNWTHQDILAHFEKLNLPKHPLVDKGYPSIGCQHCTNSVAAGEDIRSGRWLGSDKTECGIHL